MTAIAENTSLGRRLVASEDEHVAHNYHPLDVVVASGQGAVLTDVDGREYLDFLAAYSATNFGHGHPGLLAAAREQLDRVTLTSRAFHHDQLAPFAAALSALVGKDMVLPMNTGAEAVESAIKVARKWGYQVKGVPDGQARIIVAGGNFHGRTTTIISFSDDPTARDGFGPYTPGFTAVAYGDLDAVRAELRGPEGGNVVAVLIEPIQGEAGVRIPPPGYLAGLRALTREHDVLLVADEIQSGLGRTGRTLACQHEGVEADLYLLGKALGGGIVPVSAVVGDRDVLGVLRPGEHGSTFGGNPLACAVGSAVVALLAGGGPQERAARLGVQMADRIAAMVGHGVVDFRARGLWAGIDIDPSLGTGRDVCEALARRGVLAKDTHGSTIRLAPPIVISEEQLHRGLDQLEDVLRERASG
ncbi:ornithine--oxo-acid transaminase [Marmoricola sp. OAE513]|uniref:ornithine--oxo-acid transaminase n=1 Tax=Marmoricola sp. OAE513 TaxID=2817894 RepID=UPI001AE51671